MPPTRSAERVLPAGRRVRWPWIVLWTSFVTAGVLDALVFVVVDPASLHWFGGPPVDWPATAVYSATFFIFWIAIAASGAVAGWLDGDVDDFRP